jgi:hypothetical protein
MDEKCEKIKKLFHLYKEGNVTVDQRLEVEYHLLYCPECIFLLTMSPAFQAD